MRRVFGSFDLLAVYHARNLLQLEGIDTLLKNEFLSSGAGELPPGECQIELWVRNDADAGRAEALLRQGGSAGGGGREAWHCTECGEPIEPQFTHCWKCGRERAA